LLRGQVVLVQEDDDGQVLHATGLQNAGVLDDLYGKARHVTDFWVTPKRRQTMFKLWAPTAKRVAVCIYSGPDQAALNQVPMQRDPSTGVWRVHQTSNLSGKYYKYLVDVFVPGVGMVRNRVTDPYSISLTTDSARSYIADLNAAKLKPEDWDTHQSPNTVNAPTDMVIYELHVRDFSVNDASVRQANRGKYTAFTESQSNGMRHLRALAQAGVTDVHLLPIFDIATIPEHGCERPSIPTDQPDSDRQQAAVMAHAASDCFNWGYDPFHFSAPEGSYATDAVDGAKRVRELRSMVLALHRAGLRVGMDVVYNHTSTSGQQPKSVLDRIVPGYYQRLNDQGEVEHSTCCDNTATEAMMMGKLMVDSVALWATQYRMDSFRFDLMGHQPRAVMQSLQERVDQAAGHHVNLLGEGWNFGEVANGSRFVQASQLSLNGSGIGTFSDRGRDAVRGGGAMDSGADLLKRQGYINGLFYAPNAFSKGLNKVQDLQRNADLVRVGLAGSLRDVPLTTYSGDIKQMQDIDYSGQPAGYVNQPGEVVNYVENHDNQTLFDINAYKLPLNTSQEDRVRVQMLGAAINMFSQGVAYFHAGIETLRSKSMDGNSFDSGDWFNRLDWTFQDNYFGTGLPPAKDNAVNYPFIRPLFNDSLIKPGAEHIALARDMFLDLLKIRASTTLFRLRTAQDIKQRLKFYNTGPQQEPTVLAVHLEGKDYPGAVFSELIYFINVDTISHELVLKDEQGKPYQLHPVHLATGAADTRVRAQAGYEAKTGQFVVPARSALVYVVR
jgi:pullulanase-type alpha-1,6-glucosidase